jgi:phosphoenolpyruvate-protein kinase (PTS system EI component)
MHPAPAEVRLSGTALSPGLAIGRPCILSHKAGAEAGPTAGGEQRQRLADALTRMARRLEVLAGTAADRLGTEAAEIFHAYRMLLEDECFRHQLYEDIATNGVDAGEALRNRFRECRTRLSAADTDYLQQRCADILELERGILNDLYGIDSCRLCKDTLDCRIDHCHLGNDHILVARTLTANLPFELDTHTVGFLVERGSRTSHAVILARALHLPVVGNVRHLPAAVPLDTELVINGDTGEVILNPTRETLAELRQALAGQSSAVSVQEPLPDFRVMANIGRITEVEQALSAKADGIGLYRSEIEMLAEPRMPDAAEQETRYRRLLEAVGERPVTVRLLDLGADKHANWLRHNRSAGPQGSRGARLLLACPDLLREQARALARASLRRPINVLYPMIVDLEQFVCLRTLFESSVADLKPASLRHGVMFEVPSACLQARQILDVADFGSIGTNDLIQYLFAGDRTCQDGMGEQCFERHAVLWRLLEELARAANRTGKPLSVCGELAGNPDLTRRIMDTGISVVSTGAAHIAAVRRAAREHAYRNTAADH